MFSIYSLSLVFDQDFIMYIDFTRIDRSLKHSNW